MEERQNQREMDMFERLEHFQKNLEEKVNNPIKQIDRVKYYEQFEINGQPFKDVYIGEVSIQGNFKTYHVYSGNTEIMTIDENGNIEINDKFKPFIKNVELQKEIEKNEELQKLTATSEKVKPEDMEKYNQNEKKEDEQNKEVQVNEDLKKEFGEDLEISYCRKIEDNQFLEQFPELKGNKEVAMAYSKKLNSFVCVVNNGEGYQKAECIEPSKLTMKSVISMDEKGEKVERKVPHALMKTNDERKEVSVTIGQYGYIETGVIDRLPNNERLEHQVREQGQGDKGKTDYEIRKTVNKSGRNNLYNMTEEFEKNEETGVKQQDIENFDNDEILYLEDGETTTFEAEAEKANMSVEGFKELYEKAEGTTVDEKLENAHKQAELDYGAPVMDKVRNKY